MIYNIVSTGSKGNAVIIDGTILIDCGVPFKMLRPFYRRLKLVLLTHIHSDHFNPATVCKLAKERPTLRWACCDWMTLPLFTAGVNPEQIDVITLGQAAQYRGFAVTAFRTPHNVPNCCWIVQGQETLFYATDCNSLSHIECKGADLYMVEGNYKEAELEERIAAKEAAGIYPYEKEVKKNHLSEEKAIAWMAENMTRKSKYIFMHRHEER